jgi:vanillate O-demethylase ferredoxin subunit
LAGQPDHWDMFLTPEEQATNQQMMICCSRSQTAALVLDI